MQSLARSPESGYRIGVTRHVPGPLSAAGYVKHRGQSVARNTATLRWLQIEPGQYPPYRISARLRQRDGRSGGGSDIAANP